MPQIRATKENALLTMLPYHKSQNQQIPNNLKQSPDLPQDNPPLELQSQMWEEHSTRHLMFDTGGTVT